MKTSKTLKLLQDPSDEDVQLYASPTAVMI